MSSEAGKREQILEGASRAFGEYGLRKTTIDDIIREAGVARATLYKHFGTKQDVFLAVVRMEAEEMIGEVERAVAGASTTRDKLRAALITHTDVIRRKLNVLRVMVEAAAHTRAYSRAGMQELQGRAVRVYEEILSEGVASGEVSADAAGVASVLLILFKGLFMGVLAEAIGPERDALVDSILNVITDGLRPREEMA